MLAERTIVSSMAVLFRKCQAFLLSEVLKLACSHSEKTMRVHECSAACEDQDEAQGCQSCGHAHQGLHPASQG